MRISHLAATAALSLGLVLVASVPAAAQSDQAAASSKKVLGFQDPATGTFRPLNRPEPDVTATPATGTFQVAFTVTLKTPFVKGSILVCSVIITDVAITATGSNGYSETASVPVTLPGNTGAATQTCTVNIPYSWLPPTGTVLATTISGDYVVEVVPASSTTAPLGLGASRSSSSTFLNLTKLPATGTLTKSTVAATL